MAINNNVFFNCSDETSSVILQYNDIFFIPGTIAFYDNKCWIDSGLNSNLIPLSDVTFNNFETCQECDESSLSGVVLENCLSSDLAVVTFSNDDLPTVGSVVNYDNSCWEVLSLTAATTNVSTQLNSYPSCEICENFIPEGVPQYTKTNFVNCCDPTDTKIFNIVLSNFGFPFGNTVVFNNKCYSLVDITLVGVIQGSYVFPQYQNCNSCKDVIPCGTPTPTPSVTATLTPTPSITPTISSSPTTTPTPTKTPFLTPSASYTTTTTTRPAFRNECEPITLFPLGVLCDVTNPTNPNSFDGIINLVITGGTPPYSIVWSNGIVNTTSLTNLQSGEYTAFVVDYYGDFTASTTCGVIAPSPTPSATPTLTPTPSTTPAPMTGICVTFIVEGQPYQFQFEYYTNINGYPAWTASTTNTPITSVGGQLTLSWVIATPPSVSGYRITGFDSTSWYGSSTSLIAPPLTGWSIVGSSPGVTNISVISGDCPLYPELIASVYTNNTTCELSNDGSVCVVGAGGSGNYEYSIDNVLYTTTNCFYNLTSGSYTVYLKDTTTLDIVSQNVVITNIGNSQTVSLEYIQVSSTILINTAQTQRIAKQFTLNTSNIPVGVTVNLGFAISNLFEIWEPGDGNNVGTQIIISKNGSPITITAGSTTNSLTNRPSCSPYKIQGELSGSSASTTVTSTDTLTVTLTSQVTITDPLSDNCNTRLENTLGVVGSISYSGLDGCVVINTGNMNMTNKVARTLGSL
jgi:hypothetical protein